MFSMRYEIWEGDELWDSNGVLALRSEVVRMPEVSTWVAAETPRLGRQRRQHRVGLYAERAVGARLAAGLPLKARPPDSGLWPSPALGCQMLAGLQVLGVRYE